MAGIGFSENVVTVDGVNVSFSDLYTASYNAGSELVTRSGSIYVINGNVVIKNNGAIKDTDKTVTMLGQYFDIQKGSTFQLGLKYSNSSTRYGCVFTAPNLQTEYGFGGLDPNNSGNFLCYSSTVYAYCYWSFFEGNNVVDIVNSTIDGYGKISGINSVVRNVTIIKAHGKYGALFPATKIAVYDNVSIAGVDGYTVAEDLPDLANLYTLDGNTFADSTSIDVYYTNTSYVYSSLLSVLDSTVNIPIKFYGGKVTNGYNISRVDPNKNDFFHLLKFSPYIQDVNGVKLSNLPIVIKNVKGDIEYTGITGEDGSIDTWLTKYQDLAGEQVGEYMTPHKVIITHNGEDKIFTINLLDNLENFPLILQETTAIGLENMLRNIVAEATTDIKYNIEYMSSNLNTVLIAVSDNVKATEQSVKRKSMTITF